MSTLIVKELYNALKEAGVSEDKAEKSANSVAEQDKQFSEIREDIQRLEKELHLMRWMLGYLIALATTIAIKYPLF